MKNFSARVAVITGAGSGFGRAFALHAQAQGMNLALADIQVDALAQTLEMLRSRNSSTLILSQALDVRSTQGMDQFANSVFERFGACHVLFNNAGVGTGGFIWEHSVSDWEWVLGVNLWGVIHGVRCFVPRMVSSLEEGHVINTASAAGIVNAPLMGVYNVSKHAVVSLSETLYHDLSISKAQQGSKVSCSVLCPGFVPTGIHLSGRNRPDDVLRQEEATASMQQARAASAKAVNSGDLSAEQIAQACFDAMRNQQFYIFTHDKLRPFFDQRVEDIRLMRNPTRPSIAAK